MLSEAAVKDLVFQDVTDDRLFGFITRLTMDAFFYDDKKRSIQLQIEDASEGVIIIYGTGASLLYRKYNLLVYADMARWEIQLRMRKHLVDNIGVKNRDNANWMLLYKQAFLLIGGFVTG